MLLCSAHRGSNLLIVHMVKAMFRTDFILSTESERSKCNQSQTAYKKVTPYLLFKVLSLVV